MRAASRPWTCPYCGRSVPARIDKCYCGRERPQPVAIDPAPQPRVSPIRLSVIAVAAALIAGAALYYFDRGLSEPRTLRPGARALDPSRPIVRPSATDPEATRPPSDDVIKQALRAIVLVETPESRGTGYFTSPDMITTSRRAVGTHSSALITTADGRQIEGTIAASASQYDLAILHVPASAPFDGSLVSTRTNDVRPGQAVVRVSWPQEVTHGLIRGLRTENRVDLIETDIITREEDSGAPLIDRTGRVLGVVTAGHTGNPGSGYAIGLESARPYLTPISGGLVPAP